MSNGKEEIIKVPYTVVGHTTIPAPRLSILLTAEGILAIAKQIKIGDYIRITEWADYTDECENVKHYGTITVIRKD
jgi:hypothetical protein